LISYRGNHREDVFLIIGKSRVNDTKTPFRGAQAQRG